MTTLMTNMESVKSTHFFFNDEQIIQYGIASCRNVIVSICGEVSSIVSVDCSCDLVDEHMTGMLNDLFFLA